VCVPVFSPSLGNALGSTRNKRCVSPIFAASLWARTHGSLDWQPNPADDYVRDRAGDRGRERDKWRVSLFILDIGDVWFDERAVLYLDWNLGSVSDIRICVGCDQF